MPEYNVHHTGYVSHVETVEASSPEEAIEQSETGSVSLCHQCTQDWDSAGDVEVFSVTDADGETVWSVDEAPPLDVTRVQAALEDFLSMADYDTHKLLKYGEDIEDVDQYPDYARKFVEKYNAG